MPRFLLNNDVITTDLTEGTVLLDFLRQEQHLIGTRAACREGDCSSCMVLCGELNPDKHNQGKMKYRALTSCLLPLGLLEGKHIVTIEGINSTTLNPVQQALVEQGGIQCGFCTPGLVIAITAYFLTASVSEQALMIDAVSGNLCRCTGYAGIKRALNILCLQFDLASSKPENRINDLIDWKILPSWFSNIPQRLEKLSETEKNVIPDSDQQPTKVAGGTDLWVQNAQRLAMPHQALTFIDSNEGLELSRQYCTINAATRIETLRLSPVMHQLFSQIKEDFKLICSLPVRQQATVGGNLVNASPIGDMSVFLLALDATLIFTKDQEKRRLPLRQFFKAYKQIDLQAEEQMAEISFFCPETPLKFSFEKVSKRTYLDIASVNSAMLIELQGNSIKEVHISAGGVASIPLYLQQTCQFLRTKTVSGQLVKEAIAIAQTEVSPIADIRGSVAYKRLLLRQLLIAHFLKLLPEMLCWEDLR